MSGSCYSTGNLTNKGEKKFDIQPYLDSKIDSMSLYVIPISLDSIFLNAYSNTENVSKFLLHPAFLPKACHIAVQLNMENKDAFLIEYGQYLTEDSEKQSTGIFSSSNNIGSSNNPKEKSTDFEYYYINKDGVRICKFGFKLEGNIDEVNKKLMAEIAVHYYGISVNEFERINNSNIVLNKFHAFLCKINNKITLKELFKYFEGKKEWEAQGYSLLTHNCQHFGAEMIKILKAERVDESLKVRTREKLILPNCIINAFWHNEEWSMTNTLGRIPIFGFFYDMFSGK